METAGIEMDEYLADRIGQEDEHKDEGVAAQEGHETEDMERGGEKDEEVPIGMGDEDIVLPDFSVRG